MKYVKHSGGCLFTGPHSQKHQNTAQVASHCHYLLFIKNQTNTFIMEGKGMSSITFTPKQLRQYQHSKAKIIKSLEHIEYSSRTFFQHRTLIHNKHYYRINFDSFEEFEKNLCNSLTPKLNDAYHHFL